MLKWTNLVPPPTRSINWSLSQQHFSVPGELKRELNRKLYRSRPSSEKVREGFDKGPENRVGTNQRPKRLLALLMAVVAGAAGRTLVVVESGCGGGSEGAGAAVTTDGATRTATGWTVAVGAIGIEDYSPPSPFLPSLSEPSLSMRVMSGRNKAMTMLPTTTARKTIMIGSSNEVMADTALSTSSS
jgi:hypothetical protein